MDDKRNPFLPLVGMMEGWKTQLSDLLPDPNRVLATETQIAMLIDAANTQYERGEERRRRERICPKCGKETFDKDKGLCSECKFLRPPTVKMKVKAVDVINWLGVSYTGDERESAIAKFQRQNPRGFMEMTFGQM